MDSVNEHALYVTSFIKCQSFNTKWNIGTSTSHCLAMISQFALTFYYYQLFTCLNIHTPVWSDTKHIVICSVKLRCFHFVSHQWRYKLSLVVRLEMVFKGGISPNFTSGYCLGFPRTMEFPSYRFCTVFPTDIDS
jgi:hypothetical protein